MCFSWCRGNGWAYLWNTRVRWKSNESKTTTTTWFFFFRGQPCKVGTSDCLKDQAKKSHKLSPLGCYPTWRCLKDQPKLCAGAWKINRDACSQNTLREQNIKSNTDTMWCITRFAWPGRCCLKDQALEPGMFNKMCRLLPRKLRGGACIQPFCRTPFSTPVCQSVHGPWSSEIQYGESFCLATSTQDPSRGLYKAVTRVTARGLWSMTRCTEEASSINDPELQIRYTNDCLITTILL